MNDFNLKYQHWLKNATDPQVCQSLAQMKDNEEEKQDAFFADLQFGTAGLRGVMSAGTNRMNVYTVFRATTGVALYMQKHGFSSCAITYDSRNNSKRFSEVAAATLASFGIKVYLTKECMPTPYLSFMVRSYRADMGINVTASHNAPQYNGYKVYDAEGCQLTDDAANEVTSFIEGVDPFAKPIPTMESCQNGLIVYSDEQTEEMYKRCVLNEGLNSAEGITVVYSPLNGAGYRIVPEVLKRAGLTDLTVVPEQATPNGDFPTCPYPNPEKKETLALALQLAQNISADALLANDPDSDRLGVAVKHNCDYQILSGNEVGLLLCDYVLRVLKEQNKLPNRPTVVKTIVSTLTVNALAKSYGAEVVDVLTGFKYIGNTVKKLEDEGRADSFVFGFEESCGYLKGSYVRDKDGVVAAMLFCQCVAYYKRQGKTLVDRLCEIKAEFGNNVQQTFSYTFGGAEGVVLKERLFEKLRKHPLTHLGESKIVETCDYLTQTKYDLPRSNVIRYNSENGSQLILRPSGTEPLVKCYVSANGSEGQTEAKLQKIKTQLDELICR